MSHGCLQLYSGGDYGSKYDPNHIHDGSFVPTEASRSSSPDHSLKSFGILDTYVNSTKMEQVNQTFSLDLSRMLTGYDHDKERLKGQVGAFDVLLHHEPILHDGLFYANGAPINYIYTLVNSTTTKKYSIVSTR